MHHCILALLLSIQCSWKLRVTRNNVQSMEEGNRWTVCFVCMSLCDIVHRKGLFLPRPCKLLGRGRPSRFRLACAMLLYNLHNIGQIEMKWVLQLTSTVESSFVRPREGYMRYRIIRQNIIVECGTVSHWMQIGDDLNEFPIRFIR